MPSIWRQLAEPEFRLWLSVLIGMVALQCLVALWAATSKTHWFWRALAVCGSLMLFVPIRAWEPAWLFGLSSTLIIALIFTGRWIDRRWTTADATALTKANDGWRFSLRDLLLLILVISISLPGTVEIVRSFQPSNWLGWLACSGSLALVAVAAHACARGPRCWRDLALFTVTLLAFAIAWWVEYPLLGIIAVVAGLAAYGLAFDRKHWLAMLLLLGAVPACSAALLWTSDWMRLHYPFQNPGDNVYYAALVIVSMFALGIIVVILLARIATDCDAKWPWRAAASLGLAVMVLAAVLQVGTIYYKVLAATKPIVVPEPFVSPVNHYDRILEIARRIQSLDAGAVTYPRSPTGEVREVWRATKASKSLQDLYDELIVLLDAPDAIPYDPHTDATEEYGISFGRRAGTFRDVVISLEVEMRIAVTNHEYERAAKCATAMVRLADMLGRGGPEFESSVANAFRRIGYVRLMEVAHILPDDSPRLVVAALQRSVAEREDLADGLAREEHYDEQIQGWHRRFEAALASRNGFTNLRDQYLELDLTINILLQTTLAIRQFENDEGRLPDALGDLVPRYLPQIPCDPRSHPLAYHTDDQRYVLYGVGWDGVDDGGEFGVEHDYLWSNPEIKWNPTRHIERRPFDFDLETLTRERP
jgi:hypothetical protein